MTRITPFLVALFVLTVNSIPAQAQVKTEVLLEKVNSPMAGIIFGGGTFTWDNDKYMFKKITLVCSPSGGGQGGQSEAGTVQTENPPTWNATVSMLDSKTTYKVQATMELMDRATFMTVYIYSAEKTQKADGK